jgi:hypothetical protein
MRVLTARWVAGSSAAGSIALMAGALVLEYVDRDLLPASMTGWTFDNVSQQAVNLAVPMVGFVLVSRRPANWIGWLFLTAGLLLAIEAFGTQYGLRALVVAPGSLPAGRVFAWFANWVGVFPIVMLALVFLLFPTGHLRSRRWRPAAWFIAAVFALAAVVLLVTATRYWSDPFNTFSSGLPAYLTVTFFLTVVALVVGVTALVVRFARSSGEERLQLKWFAAAALLVVVTVIASFLANGAAVANLLSSLAFLCLYAAIAIAVLKYRLYGIDIVISKAVLYGSLAVFITAVYAALVVGHDELQDPVVGLQADPGLGGVGVFSGVLQCFQAAEIHRRLGVLAEPPDGVGVHDHRQRRLAGLGAQRGGQAQVGQQRRVDAAGQVAQVFQRSGGVCFELAEDRPGLGRICGDGGLGQLEFDGQGDQVLLGAVVDIAFQPAPRLVLRGDQPLPRGPQVLDQPGVGQCQPGLGSHVGDQLFAGWAERLVFGHDDRDRAQQFALVYYRDADLTVWQRRQRLAINAQRAFALVAV